MPKGRKKITFSGSLARRIFVLCCALLILPLILYSFFLYGRELSIKEADIRSTMKSLGGVMAKEIDQLIQLDWNVLDAESPPLIKSFKIQKMSLSSDVPDHFVKISLKREALMAGKKVSATEAHVILHPLAEILRVPDAPFPIDVSLDKKNEDLWSESFPIENGKITLFLGTSPDRVADLEWNHLYLRVGALLLIIVIIGGGAMWWLGKKLSRPMRALQLTMERVADGALHSRYAPHMWGFEINALGYVFNETLDRVIELQDEAVREKLEREKLACELKIGREIQASLLPKGVAEIHGFQIATGYVPAMEVSGDFYDVFPLAPGKAMIAMGDVAGKGISACLYSLGLRSTLRTLADATNDLGQLARQANDLFLLDVKESGVFATLWLGIFDGRHLSYASFGHPPAFLKRRDGIEELATGHPAFGLDAFKKIETGTETLDQGDTLILYTDGVTEAHDPDGKRYGAERLKESISRMTKASPDYILDKVLEFSGTQPQHDDIALLMIHIS